MKCWAGHHHGRHITLGLSRYDEARCIYCGHSVGRPLRKSVPLRIMDWPGEIVNRFRARRRGMHDYAFIAQGVYFY